MGARGFQVLKKGGREAAKRLQVAASRPCLAATRGMDSFLEWIRWEAASSFFGQALSNSNQGEITMGRSLQNPKNNVLEQLSQAWLCTLTVGVLPGKDCTKYLLQHIVFRVLSLQTRFPVRGGNSLRSDLPIVISPWSGPFFSPPRPQICRFWVGPKI